MAKERATATGPIHLSSRSNRLVTVEPEDEDRFTMAAKEAVRACQHAQNEKELLEDFDRLLLHVRQWCEKRNEVSTAYVYPADGTLNIVICTKGDDYRLDFDDALTELDLE